MALLVPLLSRRAPRLAAASAQRPWASPPSPLLHLAPSRSVVTIKKFTADRARRVPKTLSTVLAAPSAPRTRDADGPAASSSVRLAKRIAMSGLCSRREAEKLILQRQVTVNGRVAEDVGTNVRVADDVVAVDGKPLARAVDRRDGKPRTPKVWMAHKLPGELVTASDPQGRATIFDRLRVMGLTQHLMPVGRLDFNTEGLLLLTNDGDYARQLEHPKSEVPRVYRALVRGNVRHLDTAWGVDSSVLTGRWVTTTGVRVQAAGAAPRTDRRRRQVRLVGVEV